MPCPPAIADVLLQILQIGLLRIRAAGWDNQADVCARHADHLHNLPTLLADYSPDRMLYYWQVERSCFTEHSDPEENVVFAPLWERLETLLPADGRLVELGQR